MLNLSICYYVENKIETRRVGRAIWVALCGAAAKCLPYLVVGPRGSCAVTRAQQPHTDGLLHMCLSIGA